MLVSPGPQTQNKKMAIKTSTARRSDEILDITIKLLAYDGHASVSMRKIADRAGIRLSTLQYYFPTKRKLLQSAIERCIGDVVKRMDKMALKSKLAPEKLFHKILKLHLSISIDPFISKFFFALWALAGHDAEVETLLNEVYERDCLRYAEFIRRINPGLSKKAAHLKAVLILAQLEGLVLFVTSGKPNAANLRSIEKELLTTVDKIIF